MAVQVVPVHGGVCSDLAGRCVVKTLRVKTPGASSPFFFVEGVDGIFVNVLWNWGEPVDVPVEALVRLLDTARPGEVVLGRLLAAADAQKVMEQRGDADSEALAFLVPREEIRWRPRRRR
jgi:hypothetical protein